MRIHSTITLFISMCFVTHAVAQDTDIVWSKSYGGSDYEFAQCVRPTADGGFIVAGTTPSTNGDITTNHGEYDVWILKLDNTGEMQWERCYGGTKFDGIQQIEQTADEGYIFAGQTTSNDGDVSGLHGGSDGWVVKTDSAGNIQWQHSYGGTADEGISSFVIKGNNYGFLGSTSSTDGDLSNNPSYGLLEVWLMETDSIGNIISSKTYGSSGNDFGTSICYAPSGKYVMLCRADGPDGDVNNSNYHPSAGDYWILMVDDAGQIQFSKCFGGSYQDFPESIINTSDGGYVVIGNSASIDGDVTGHQGSQMYLDYWVIKLNSSGSLVWQKNIGGTKDDMCYSVIESLGNLFIAGSTSSIDGDVTNNHGEFQSPSDGWLVKLSSDGNILWQNSYGGSSGDGIYAIIQSIDGSYVCAGASFSFDDDVSSNNGADDFWIFKLSATTAIIEPTTQNSNLVFPNPTTAFIHFKNTTNEKSQITIINLLGHGVYSNQLSADEQLEIDMSEYPKGVYFFILNQGLRNQLQKIILE